ncbi:hypothetical protein HYX19_00590 [Candidatus Woesearchaeota archaeon]|nr:hypothetical protein [Candidatus Woesearchaeota archaeon]
MKVEIKKINPSLVETLETLIYSRPLDVQYIKSLCNITYFEKVEIRVFSKECSSFITSRDAGEIAFDTEVSYIKLRFFRENKPVKTLRIKETDRDVDYCINSLKYHLEKIDLLKWPITNTVLPR